ncbi:MAG: hypothetical protein P8N76_06720 [Pirellulaceae bacterium]|nr:hypothetical protein [Pirellulaceae bacterium]
MNNQITPSRFSGKVIRKSNIGNKIAEQQSMKPKLLASDANMNRSQAHPPFHALQAVIHKHQSNGRFERRIDGNGRLRISQKSLILALVGPHTHNHLETPHVRFIESRRMRLND